MKDNYTHLAILLDKSGSMQSLKKSIISGFNELIDSQKNQPGDLTITIKTFSNPGADFMVNDFANIDSVRHLTDESYDADGVTALYDAFVTLVDSTGKTLAEMPEENRPSKVLFTIITDGEDNSSREYTITHVKDKIKHQEEKYGWNFSYIGANVDAYAVGGSLGITRESTMNFMASDIGTKDMMVTYTSNLTRYRNAPSNSNIALTTEGE